MSRVRYAQPPLIVVLAKGRPGLAGKVRALGFAVVEDRRQVPTLLPRDRRAKPWAPDPGERHP